MGDQKDISSDGTSPVREMPKGPSDGVAEKVALEHLEKGTADPNPARFSKKEEDAVIRKLDWNVMPFLFVLYSLSVLDRSNLGNARIAGMEDDIDLSGRRYDWLATVFYIAYILSQWTTVGWKAFKPHRWVAFATFSWGFVSTIQSATSSWGGLMACRTLLGVIEAMFGPGIPLYLSYFYPREKLGLRTGIFLSGSALASAYGGALAYGISQAKSASIGPWQILFIVEGVPTCLIAVVAYFFLPDSPEKARFLNEREKEIAIALSLRQPGDRETEGLQWKQVLGALMDYRSYLPSLMYFGCNVSFASLPLFIPTIISEMGAFSTVQSNGMSAPPYVLCWISIVTASFISDRVGMRGPFVAGGALLGAIGFILLGATSSVGVRYFGIFLAVHIFVSVALILTWVGNTHATDSKRAGGLAILATGGQCGPILGTNIFPKSDAPFYRKGMWISCGMCFLVFGLALLQMLLLWRDNRKRDREYGRDRDTTHISVEGNSGKDSQFRYML